MPQCDLMVSLDKSPGPQANAESAAVTTIRYILKVSKIYLILLEGKNCPSAGRGSNQVMELLIVHCFDLLLLNFVENWLR